MTREQKITVALTAAVTVGSTALFAIQKLKNRKAAATAQQNDDIIPIPDMNTPA